MFMPSEAPNNELLINTDNISININFHIKIYRLKPVIFKSRFNLSILKHQKFFITIYTYFLTKQDTPYEALALSIVSGA